jgi:hypothetical protein
MARALWNRDFVSGVSTEEAPRDTYKRGYFICGPEFVYE